MNESIYLKDSHEGWIINLVSNGIEIIGPGTGELEILQENYNTVTITEPQREG